MRLTKLTISQTVNPFKLTWGNYNPNGLPKIPVGRRHGVLIGNLRRAIENEKCAKYTNDGGN